MPTRRQNGTYYVKRTFRGVGLVYRSLHTKKKARAQARERVLESLHEQGRHELVRAFDRGQVTIQRLEEAFETGKVHELAAELRQGKATLAEASTAALTNKAPDVRTSTYERYETGLEHFRAFVGDVSVQDALTSDRVQEFKAYRLASGAAEQTVNNDLGAVSVLVTYALKKGWIHERPEINRFSYRSRIRWLDRGQLATYMAALRPRFRVQHLLLVGSGMRLGESEALRVCDLRLGDTDNRALVDDSKTTSGVRTVFLPPWAASALAEHIEEHGLRGTDRLFTIGRRIVQREHDRACLIAGIHEYTLHDHRHTAAVHLARAGIPLQLLQQQLGHKHIEMTMKYARFHPDYSDVAGYFDLVGEHLGLGTGNKPGNTPRPEATTTEVYDAP